MLLPPLKLPPASAWRWRFLLTIVLFTLAWIVFIVAIRPSHDRVWELGQEALPQFLIEGDRLRVDHLRRFRWTGEATAEPHYETRMFDLRAIRTLDVFISHFDDFEGLAHIFLSFGFSDGQQLVISLESRREVGEEFSPLLGLFRQYEIIYVVGSEEDIVGVRTAFRGERVYRYPTIATPDQARALLLRLGDDINGVAEAPRFYNTFLHNCTNELTRRVEDIASVNFPFTWKTLLPGYFDEVLYEMQLIEGAVSFAETKESHLIDNTRVDPTHDGYSQSLRTPTVR